MVDLECSRPVALLKDRSAETLAEWLLAYPEIKIVSRDRALAYAKGIRQGVPDAIQVADRFHLLQNLAETLYQVFSTHHQALKAVDEAFSKKGRGQRAEGRRDLSLLFTARTLWATGGSQGSKPPTKIFDLVARNQCG